jgi:hypothetical protein
MTRLPGLGPKRARRLYEELRSTRSSCAARGGKEHRIRELKGFGAKAEEALLAALDAHDADRAGAGTVLSRRCGRRGAARSAAGAPGRASGSSSPARRGG